MATFVALRHPVIILVQTIYNQLTDDVIRLSKYRAYKPYTLSGIPNGEPPSCEAPQQPTIYICSVEDGKNY